jgi:hypothetical protein
MADDQHDYKVAPAARRCTPVSKRAVRQPRRPQPKEAACAAGRCAAPTLTLPRKRGREGRGVFVTIDGERRKITKREAVVHQLVNKSATADLRATKMLFDMIKDVEQKASVTSPVSEPRRLDAADEEVVQNFVDRI